MPENLFVSCLGACFAGVIAGAAATPRLNLQGSIANPNRRFSGADWPALAPRFGNRVAHRGSMLDKIPDASRGENRGAAGRRARMIGVNGR
jgi:hypothetical protein